MRKTMSFSDRQIFIQHLAIVRNLSVELASYEPIDSPLLQRCRELQSVIDAMAGEMIGDAGYFQVKDYPARA
jgi:ribosomal protein L17